MEERKQPELTNPELDALLQEWRTPIAPSRLRSAVFSSHSVPWYRRWLATSIRIPVPIAVVLCVMLLLSGWQWGAEGSVLAPRPCTVVSHRQHPPLRIRVSHRWPSYGHGS
jgi:hypothetical protein